MGTFNPRRRNRNPMSTGPEVDRCLTDYFRCPGEFVRLSRRKGAAYGPGYFSFGEKVVCFGKYVSSIPAADPGGPTPDAQAGIEFGPAGVRLPFDPAEVTENLHRERYTEEWRAGSGLVARAYYFVRPLLPVGVRKHLQKFHLRNWRNIAFPRWPVDSSVDDLLEEVLLLCLRERGEERIPFIWFWPKGKSSCAIMTHDVEMPEGRDFCPTLMEVDRKYGIRASYQVVPEERYSVSPEFLASLRAHGCEVAVHDLNHDGHLYENREQFEQRAQKINAYLKEYQADGFRAGVLYRKQVWFEALECAFDMSVPNVAHLDPQRGGCCTVMPYFLRDVLEIPVTMIQDYTLFHILNDYSIDIWKQQAEIVMARHGLMSFIVHPDYVMTRRSMAVYEELLQYLVELEQERDVWMATPGEVNRWWRQRAAMRLVERNGSWRIEGPGSDRARLAWATERDGRLQLTMDDGARTASPACAAEEALAGD